MGEDFRKLFIELCRSTAVLAETVMDYDKKNNDEKGYEVAESMRNDYNQIEDMLKDNKEIGYNEYVKLLAASYMSVNNLQDQVATFNKAIKGYKTVTIPRLTRIMEEAKDNPEKLQTLVEELFKNSEA